MKILVDTCVWSIALRHKNPDKNITKKLSDIISERRAVLIGPIKQEILSGISQSAQFEKLKDILSAFEEIQLKSNHFEIAAEFCNTCIEGVQGSTIDFLICAVSYSENMVIFSVDKDFENYAKHLPMKLLE